MQTYASDRSWASSGQARRTMRANKRKETRPELALRSRLHARGLRFRVDFAPLNGTRRRADVVFTRARIAVFVDGCFWHGCPDHFVAPKSNADYWREKIQTNVERDRDTDHKLLAAGWTVLRLWEHEELDQAADVIVERWRTRLNEGSE